MSVFSSGSEARLGSMGVAPMLPCPPLPNIIAEWASIIPLICHLASQRDDYITTGDVALMGRLSVGLLPRLGTLSGIARLLRRGSKYLDYASSKGGSSRTAWDVKWGSVFPCANGAAVAAISNSLRGRNMSPPQRMPEAQSCQLQGNDPEILPTEESPKSRPARIPFRHVEHKPRSNDAHPEEQAIRRYQVLHVYQLHRQQRKRSTAQRIYQMSQSKPAQILWFAFSLCLAVFLSLWGCYGTAVIMVCMSISELLAQSILIRRPAGYLRNNENHDACMLVAPHENATEWHLYIGDRAIADTLLNKPMFVVPEGGSTRLLADWFWLANLLQLTAMTFVAAQKGWDGVCLVAVLAINWASYWSLRRQTLADDWLEREGIAANVESFEFGGRTAMLGAIQVFSESPTADWMDRILVPHPRRAAWLSKLRGEEASHSLEAHDARWLEFATEASLASAEVLTRAFGVGGVYEAV